MDTLVLDVSYQPIARTPWETAIVQVIVDRVAEVVDEYPDRYIRTPSWTVNMPSVIRLLMPVPRKKAVKFSRQNVWTRDDGRCQYCGVKVPKSNFTYDHVVPRRLGGATNWENVVVCCERDNQRKGGRTPEQAGMKLLSKPVRPKKLAQAPSFLTYEKGMPLAWKDWMRDAVYWNGSLEEG